MIEYGSFTSLVGSDGTTALLNGATGLVLTDCSGFDSPNVRTNVQDLPEADGAAASQSYLGQRPVTLTGSVINVTAAARNTLIATLQQAARGLASDATLYASPSGQPAMKIACRYSSLRVTGQFLKQFQLQMICADPRIYSQTVHTQSASGMVTSPGANFPLVFPIVFGGTTGATTQVVCTNAGNYGSPPVLTVTGPISNPQISNATSGLSIYIDNVSLLAGETITVDMKARTAVNNSGVSLYGSIRFPASDWWTLLAGDNTIRLWGNGSSNATTLSASWNDVWV